MTTDDTLDRDTMNRDKLNKEINKLIDHLRKTTQNEQVVGMMVTSLIATEHDDKLTVVSEVQYTVPAKLTALLMQSAAAYSQATLQSLHEAATMADEEPTGDSQIILPSSRKLDS